MRAFSFQAPGRRSRSARSSGAAAAVLVLVCGALALLPAQAAAQWPGRVEGRVVDALSRRAVSDAVVSVDLGASPGAPSATTDGSGRFTLKGLDDGRHTLLVRRPGYAPVRVEVEVGEGRVARPRVVLEPAPMAHEGLDVKVTEVATGGFRVESAAGTDGTAGDLLRAAPGVVVNRRGGGGAETVSIRGSAAHEVLVLVDGVPLNDPVTGVADLSRLSASSVAAVVVLPGARSAKYGARAQGGVVLVESRAPAPGLRSHTTVASLGGLGAELRVGGVRDGDAGWAVSGQHERIDGAFDFRLPESVGGGEGSRSNADLTRSTLAAALDLPAGPGSLELRLRGEDLRRGLPGRSFAPSPHARQRERSLQLSAGWEAAIDGFRVSGDAFGALRRGRVRDPAPPAGLPWDDRTRAWSAGTRLRAATERGGLDLGGGIEVQSQSVSSEALVGAAAGSRTDAGLFATVEGGRRLEPVRLVGRLAGRVDRSGTEGRLVPSHEASLQLSAGERGPTSATVHAAWRSAFSPPTLADQHFRSGVGVEPNPDLRGERVPRELEAGVAMASRVRGALLSASVIAYRSDVRGMIEWAPDFRFVWSPRNVDVRRRGVDVRGAIRVPLGGGSATVAGSWSRARATYDRVGEPDVQLRYRPLHTGVLSAAWARAPVEVELAGRYTGRRHPVPAAVNALPGFWYADFSARGRISLGDAWSLAPTLRVERLFDTSDTLIFGFPHPGRTFSLGVGVTGAGAGR